jgi:RNA polymerase sigma-70 factor, ECF subfamily
MSVSPANIQSIITRAQQGDETAITTLYQTYVEKIYRYIAYRVPTTNDAEDLTGEVFVKMVEGLPNYRFTGAPFESWLYRIASARVADWYRKAKRNEQVELTEQLSDSKPSPEESLLENVELDLLREAIKILNEEQKQVLLLRFVERKSHAEVSAIIGKSVSAIKSIQHRALTRLAEKLGAKSKGRHYLRGGHD